MAKAKPIEIVWLPDVAEHDYPAAASYLALLYTEAQVTAMLTSFRSAPLVQYKAKDIFRASQLSLLGVSNSHVEKDRKKIRQGKSLSPLLLLRDEQHGKVVIADGYHRLCAIYEFNEDAWIHCKIIEAAGCDEALSRYACCGLDVHFVSPVPVEGGRGSLSSVGATGRSPLQQLAA